MHETTKRLTAGELLDIFSLSQSATAIYTTEDIIINAATDSMIAFWGKDRCIIGKPMLEAIPELKGQPFISILQEVWRTGITYQSKEAQAELMADGRLQTFYFDFVYKAVKNEDGTMRCILHTATDVTENVKSKYLLTQTKQYQEVLEREQGLNEELSSSVEELRAVNNELTESQERLFTLNNELEERVESRTLDIKNSENRFRSLVEQMPVAINLFLTRDLIVDLPNRRMLEIWGRTFDEVNGKPLDVSMPELQGQPFMQKLRDVIATGIPYSSSEEKAFIQRNGRLEELYFDIVYQPVINPDGSITSCVQIATDVTEAVLSRQRIQSLNEELASINEELSSANEELADTVEQVNRERKQLNHFFMQAPAGICVLSGPNLVYELVNPGYQTMLPGRDLEGRPIFEALPELEGTPLQQVLLDVYWKSQPATFIELLIPIAASEGGLLQERYFTFHYIPRKNETGNTDGIMAFVYEVTDQVFARRKVEQAEESLRIATESAELGTWSYYPGNDKFLVSSRFRKIFGFQPDKDIISHREKMSLVHPEYQPIVEEALKASLDGDVPLYLEYPITAEEKQKWVRVVGKKVEDDSSGIYITGVVADVTEQKRDEQRKNDFIGMVSHEMKTPLTSLNGYLQLLQMKVDANDAVANNMLGKATKQVSRLTTLINGFLNVSRLESGKIQIDKKRFDMADLIKEAEEEIQSTINSHKVVFAPVLTTWVHADRDKINQVVSNLISNAVKYSPANTVINVACVTVDGNATVSVTDKGIGIKPEDQPKLFDRYYRVNNDNATSASGFGIGLYLCAEIIQRHDGKIWVESEVGKGSTFSFSLPVID